MRRRGGGVESVHALARHRAEWKKSAPRPDLWRKKTAGAGLTPGGGESLGGGQPDPVAPLGHPASCPAACLLRLPSRDSPSSASRGTPDPHTLLAPPVANRGSKQGTPWHSPYPTRLQEPSRKFPPFSFACLPASLCSPNSEAVPAEQRSRLLSERRRCKQQL